MSEEKEALKAELEGIALELAKESIEKLVKFKHFTTIHKVAPAKYLGQVGVMVWYSMVRHKVAFVNWETKDKFCVRTTRSYTKAEAEFKEYVEKYGIEG